MTRMFQALKKANGDLARVALPLIDSAGGVRTEDVDEIQEQTVVPVPPPMEQPIRTVAVLVAEGSPFMIGKAISCAASEQYRIIRTRVLQHDRETKMLLVSSATPGDGKTVTAINVGADVYEAPGQ